MYADFEAASLRSDARSGDAFRPCIRIARQYASSKESTKSSGNAIIVLDQY